MIVTEIHTKKNTRILLKELTEEVILSLSAIKCMKTLVTSIRRWLMSVL